MNVCDNYFKRKHHSTTEFSVDSSTRFEEEDGNLAHVEIDEVLRLVGDITAEVAANDAMPGWVVLFVKLLLDVSSDVLLDVEFLQSLGGAVNSVLLHLLRHVGILDDGFPLRHL